MMPKPTEAALRPSFGLTGEFFSSTNPYISFVSCFRPTLTQGQTTLEWGTYEGNDYFLGDVEMHWQPPAPIVPYG